MAFKKNRQPISELLEEILFCMASAHSQLLGFIRTYGKLVATTNFLVAT
jgi:hypothetical protein